MVEFGWLSDSFAVVSAVFTSFVAESAADACCSVALSAEVGVLPEARASDDVAVRVAAGASDVAVSPSAGASGDVVVSTSSAGASEESAADPVRAVRLPAPDETVPDSGDFADSSAPGDSELRFAAASFDDEPAVAAPTALPLPSTDATAAVSVSRAAVVRSAPPSEASRVPAAAWLAAVSSGVDRAEPAVALSVAAAAASGGSDIESFRPVGSLFMIPSDFGCA
ncbi:hypothetical protein [Nocardia amikacinitolerans]|uniref:hypothetical protein n=1 Tax=Nocardia amikacinitolerans TaxID=756689 RepID=UPI0020A3C4C6|nr:hypothetical protein [Nocardia amikacinitolerans]